MKQFFLYTALLVAAAAGLPGAADAQSIGGGITSATQASPAGDANAKTWEAIGLDRAAHFAVFRRPVKVAIIDDGFDLDNPLWAAQIAHNKGDIPGNNIDDDHNGKVDDYEGWDFGDNDEDVRPAKAFLDKESHGTRVLGVFWQTLQQLCAGSPTGITVIPIKAVSDAHLNNYLKEGYKGIEYAIQQKADIILCSWSGPMIDPDEKAMLATAQAKGIMVIAAAGNFYALQPMYPGAIPSVIDVAATRTDGRRLPVSNYGTFVDISAPGDSLTTYDPYVQQPHAHLSATSAATPIVAAVVTAIRAARPDLSPAAIERLIKNTATPLESENMLYAGDLGAGMINVAAIRDALANSQAATVDDRHRPQGYVDLSQLHAKTPIRITPIGHYPGIKFTLPPGPCIGVVRVTLFKNNTTKDTTIRDLRYPFLALADSLYLYKGSTDPHGTATQGAPFHGWWYYSAITLDSSTMYCGSTVDIAADAEGYIEDGSGAATYTGRNDCKWQLTAPEGKQILLSFDEFDTEPKVDQVYIFNGNSTKDPILAIFSGHKLPPPIRSWGNTVLVWFLTNEENNFQGWKLHYKVVDAVIAH